MTNLDRAMAIVPHWEQSTRPAPARLAIGIAAALNAAEQRGREQAQAEEAARVLQFFGEDKT